MKAIGIRELKTHLSEYIRRVRGGEQVLVTDRGEIVAELRQPGKSVPETPYPVLMELVRQGKARPGAPNRPDLYPRLPALLAEHEIAGLLDEERGER